MQHAAEDHDVRGWERDLEEVGADEGQPVRHLAFAHQAVEVLRHGRSVEHGAGQRGVGGREPRCQVAAGPADVAERCYARPVEDLGQPIADGPAEAVHGRQELSESDRVVEDPGEGHLAAGALAAGGAVPEHPGEGLLVGAHEFGGDPQETAHELLAVRQQVAQHTGAVAVAAVLPDQESDGGHRVEEVLGTARVQTRAVGEFGAAERAVAERREHLEVHRCVQELAPEEGPSGEHDVERVVEWRLPGSAGGGGEGGAFRGGYRPGHARRTSFVDVASCSAAGSPDVAARGPGKSGAGARRPIRDRSPRSTGRS